VVNLTCISD